MGDAGCTLFQVQGGLEEELSEVVPFLKPISPFHSTKSGSTMVLLCLVIVG